ncbi:MAG: alpha/beta hydrolase [Phycisphaerae bacterium]|nr:alpha/beta hydrolase [Phycisphaerae bacterium]
MKTTVIRVASVLAVLATSRLIAAEVAVDKSPARTALTFPGKKTPWNGYERYDFTFDKRHCTVVTPKSVAVGKPWIWRARFFGHRPEVDLALLGKGFHLGYIDVANLFGSPEAVEHWNAFYRLLTEKHGLAKKPALEGMSRGGLIVFNWAAKNPEKVACIYADAPVCDFKSWPGGKGKGSGSPECWQLCLKAYGLTEAEAVAYKHNPIDNLEPLARAHVPLLHVSGNADKVVPLEENTRIVEERYKALGGKIDVIIKDGVGHKHGLDDPKPIIEFILKHTAGVAALTEALLPR